MIRPPPHTDPPNPAHAAPGIPKHVSAGILAKLRSSSCPAQPALQTTSTSFRTILFFPVLASALNREHTSVPKGRNNLYPGHGSAGNRFENSRVPFRGRHTPSARTRASSPARRRSRAPRNRHGAEGATVEERRLQRRESEQTRSNSARPWLARSVRGPQRARCWRGGVERQRSARPEVKIIFGRQ